jgi:hypothetical protein
MNARFQLFAMCFQMRAKILWSDTRYAYLQRLLFNNLFLKLFKAAEALGALSAESAKPLLEKYLTCPERAVRETCEIALDKIKWDATPEGQAANNKAKEMKEQGTA